MASPNIARESRVSSVIPSHELPNQAKLYLITWPDAQGVQRTACCSRLSLDDTRNFSFLILAATLPASPTHTFAKQKEEREFQISFWDFSNVNKNTKISCDLRCFENEWKEQRGKGTEKVVCTQLKGHAPRVNQRRQNCNCSRSNSSICLFRFLIRRLQQLPQLAAIEMHNDCLTACCACAPLIIVSTSLICGRGTINHIDNFKFATRLPRPGSSN